MAQATSFPVRHSHVSPARPSVRIWQITRHRVLHRSAAGNSGNLATRADTHHQLCWPNRFRSGCRSSSRDNNQRFVLELARLPERVHRQLCADRDCRFRSHWSYRRTSAAKAHSCSLNSCLVRDQRLTSRTVNAGRPFRMPYVASAAPSLLLKRRSVPVFSGTHFAPELTFRNFAISFSERSLPFARE
jgi:hypothetical protein